MAQQDENQPSTSEALVVKYSERGLVFGRDPFSQKRPNRGALFIASCQPFGEKQCACLSTSLEYESSDPFL